MKEKFKSVSDKLKNVWGGLTKVAKIVICAALGVILVGSIVLTIFLNRKSSSDWIVLFPNMSQEESTEVYLQLQNKNVQTKINSKGEIEVKRNEWDNLVFELAQMGYPQSAPSYGTFFDHLSMTMTEFEKKQTLRFELQDRLQTTLKRLDGVLGAIVTINVPESSGYAWEQNDDKATASVMLTLSNSAGFTPASVSAVKKLVAYSAQQMQPEDVAVINAQTNQELLSEEAVAEQGSNEISMEDRMKYANTFKSQYEANAKQILLPIYPDGVDAVAAVELDYDKIVEERREHITNENGESVKEHEEIRYNTNAGTVSQGGVVGEENNSDIPNYQQGADPVLDSDNTDDFEHIIDWDESGYNLVQSQRAQGVIKDASISVVVANDTGYLSRDERNGVVQLVKNATNIPEDKVSVFCRQIGQPINPEPTPIFPGLDKKRLIILIGLCSFVLLLITLLVIFLIIRRMKKKMRLQQEASQAEIDSIRAAMEEDEKKTLAEAADEHSKTEKAAETEVREFAQKNPEIAAAIIRSMLRERDE